MSGNYCKKIRGTFHGNDLKLFTPREGYLKSSADLLEPEPTIRKKKKKGKSDRGSASVLLGMNSKKNDNSFLT